MASLDLTFLRDGGIEVSQSVDVQLLMELADAAGTLRQLVAQVLSGLAGKSFNYGDTRLEGVQCEAPIRLGEMVFVDDRSVGMEGYKFRLKDKHSNNAWEPTVQVGREADGSPLLVTQTIHLGNGVITSTLLMGADPQSGRQLLECSIVANKLRTFDGLRNHTVGTLDSSQMMRWGRNLVEGVQRGFDCVPKSNNGTNIIADLWNVDKALEHLGRTVIDDSRSQFVAQNELEIAERYLCRQQFSIMNASML
ncbi:MAG: hypothetical protein HY817_04280 [Candidatus Abawacabacteria bacterium]|nr:hypothetical protein [Candidatus Abawacabacteria bacterium]